jgi:hypothetical protein
MNQRGCQNRSIAPLILGAALALAGLLPVRSAPAVRIERVRVDPGRDPRHLLESLEGLGDGVAGRIVEARRGVLAIDAPADLITVPGVGTRLLHRWHADLAFPREDR